MKTQMVGGLNQEYSLRFGAKAYWECDALQDCFKEMASHPGVHSRFENRDGRKRNVLRIKFRSATLVVTPHEWGVEYIVSFALGVASEIVAHVIYDFLKDQVSRYAEMLKRVPPERRRNIRVDVKVDSPNGAVKIGVIEHGQGSITITVAKLKKVIDEIDVEKGIQPQPRASKKRIKK